jgi:uncharacterized C2H2 Zn-finger protein
MTEISKRLEQIVRKELSKTIIPVKTEEGILVGNVLIKSRDNLKYLYKNGDLIYGGIFLNQSAIALANILARISYDPRAEQIYLADKDYAKHFIDSQLMRTNYEKSKKNRDFDRADMLWARYEQARDRAQSAKSRVESLSKL